MSGMGYQVPMNPTAVLRSDVPVAVSRARYSNTNPAETEARVFVTKPASPTATKFKATLIVPKSECGTLVIDDQLTINP
jgi:hypothetical protein